MVGTSGGTLGGRERIIIVDELLPGRLKRAARRHILRRPQLWRSILVISLSVVTVLVVSALADGHTRALTAAVLGLPAFAILTVAAVMGGTLMTVGRRIDREFVAGRLIGLTIGSHTIRFRDHDSCVEYAYSCVRGIETLGDVIVITVSSSFWLVPTEMLDGVSLEVLRTRAGRPVPHGEAWPNPAS
jgi:hypothetical protein